ncbi:MAG: hypothetical protein IKK08_03000 [Clostridia bacterium]|nr:hypothetical protein [Clostridia bacterium]
MPQDQKFFQLHFWNLRKAAKEWGCSYQTARRWVLLHPSVGVLVRVQAVNALVPRWQLCVFAGQKKFDRGEGAKHFRSSTWQRSMARRRWRRQRASDRGEAAPDRLPVPHYGRCRQPIPGTNFPNHVKDQRQQLHRQQLPADHKPLEGQLSFDELVQHSKIPRYTPAELAELDRILSRPLPRS